MALMASRQNRFPANYLLCVFLAVAIRCLRSFRNIQRFFCLGAFFAGMVMRESQYAHRAAVESLPLRDAFSVTTSLSVSAYLFDPSAILEHPFYLLGILFLNSYC